MEITSWDELLPPKPKSTTPAAPSAPQIKSWDDLLPQKSNIISTPQQAAEKAATEAGALPDGSKGQTSSDEGFWRLAGRSFIQSAVTAGQETAAGAKAAVPSALGGSTLEQQAAQLPEPDAQDEVTRLNRQPISLGYTNPRWWGVKLGANLGAVAPAAALGGAGVVAGGMAAGPPGALAGGAAGGGIGMALQQVVPAYKAAVARGLDHDSAVNEAITQSGIAGGFGAAMGLTGAVPVFGTTITGTLRRPISEALLKLGVAQPGLMVAQQQAQKAAGPGGWITPDEALEGYIMGAGVGGVLHAAHAVTVPLANKVREQFQPALTSEGVHSAFTAVEGQEPELPALSTQTKGWPQNPEFYSKISDKLSAFSGNDLKPEEWHKILRDTHASAEHVELPQFLAEENGTIPKERLLSFIESRGIRTQTDYGKSRDSQTVSLFEPTGKSTPFATVKYIKTTDRDGSPVLAVTHAYVTAGRMGDLKSNPWDLMSYVLAEKAVKESADRIVTHVPIDSKVSSDLNTAMRKLAEMHGMQEGVTRPSGFGQDYPFFRISPVNASNIRQGTSLLSRPPGTYLNNDPHKAGRDAINAFLDRAQASAVPRSEWVQTPEGGNGLYMRLRREGDQRLVDLANLDFERRGTGAFRHYLDHIEREAVRRGLDGVRVENIMNKRLPDFLQRRGYVKEDNLFDDPETPSMRIMRDAIAQKHSLNESKARDELAKKGFPTARESLITPKELRPAGVRIQGLIERLRKSMGIKAPIVIEIHDSPGPDGELGNAGKSGLGYHINLYLSPHDETGAEGLYATAAHEFGHVVMWHFFDRSPMAVKNNITNAYDQWRRAAPPGETMNQMGLRRNNAIDLAYGGHFYDPDFPVLSLTPERQRYWTGFEEWFAEQTARWATTGEKPLGNADQFFHSLGRRIVSVISKFRQHALDLAKGRATAEDVNKMAIEPSIEMKNWLDSLMKDVEPFAADIIAAAQLRSLKSNQGALNAAGEGETHAVPETGSTGGGRGLIRRIFGRSGPNPEMAAGADRFNKFYEWMISMPQLAKLNGHIEPLQRYNQISQMYHAMVMSMRGEGERTVSLWRALLPKQSDSVAGLIDDYGHMKYRTAAEIAAKVTRRPTEDELGQMARDRGVNDKGMAVFRAVVADYDRMLTRLQLLLEQDAHKLEDPVTSAQKLADIAAQIAQMRKGPYVPAMRFGEYTLTVRDSADKVVHFETFESQRKRDAAFEAARSHFPSDHTVRAGALRKDVAPLLGLPPGLLDKIGEKLNLSNSQRAALDELRFEYVPAQSFAHRFQGKNDVPGYSTDFLRAHANYMFHGANYLARAFHVDALSQAIKDLDSTSLDLAQGTKRDQIANFLRGHFDALMNPRADFAILRSAMFHWALGFSPAAATLNLSQTILGTYPYLASKFGSDVRAVAAMARASTKLSTFYTKMRLEGTTDPELKGIAEAVRQGVISETQANVLAATADGRVLSQGFGGNRAEKAFSLFSRASQFFFEMTEQTNRRVAFRAAWDMAMSDPGNPHVSRTVRENQLLFDSLRLRGFTDQEARAFVTAKDAVDSTQYVYAPYARPKFMTHSILTGRQGGLGQTLFIFKSFTQNTLFYLWNNPGAAARSLIILGAAGGIMGLPGMEDMNGILRALAYHLFGKDFDLQDEVRKYVLDVLHGGGHVDRPGSLSGEYGIRPDILLHGLSRVGYGLPAIADLMGNIAGQGHVPMPVFDRHMNLSMGNILPIEPGVLAAPQITGPGAGQANIDSTLAHQTQRASGAAFGVGFSLYRALENSLQGGFEWKKWESAMPTALRNASQAFRFYTEGKARNSQGAALVRFDPNNPEEMMEILGQAMGYRPERLSAAWDRRTAEKEAEAFWDVRKAYLTQAAWTAKSSGDSASYQASLDAIKKFNRDLPAEARGKAITSDGLRASFESRARATAATETGIPRQRGNVPLARSVQRLYPEASPAGRYPPQGGALGKP